MKKLVVIVLVIAMAFSLSVTALADEGEEPCLCGLLLCSVHLPNAEIGVGSPIYIYTDQANAEVGIVSNIDLYSNLWWFVYFGLVIDPVTDDVIGFWPDNLFDWLSDQQDLSNDIFWAVDPDTGDLYFVHPPEGFRADPYFNAIMAIGAFEMTLLGNPYSADTRFSFTSEYLSPNDIVQIVQYIDGAGWAFIGNAEYIDGTWWFLVEDFGQLSFFFALIEYFIAQGYDAGAAAAAAGRVLGAASPATGDSTLSMIAIALLALSALGLATFSVAKARKEMI